MKLLDLTVANVYVLFILATKDYSRFGSCLGTNGPTIPYLLLMLKSIKQGRPDIVIHENVQGFPWQEVLQLLTSHFGKKQVRVLPVCLLNCKRTSLGLYDVSASIINPAADCGVPVQRVRRYTILTLKDRVRLRCLL